jgi:hypothetical protein
MVRSTVASARADPGEGSGGQAPHPFSFRFYYDVTYHISLNMMSSYLSTDCRFWYFVKTIVEASVKAKFAYVYNSTNTFLSHLHTDYEREQTISSYVVNRCL